MVGKPYQRVKKRNTPSRISIMVGMSFVLMLVVGYRMFNLQVLAHDSYVALAEGQHTIYEELVPERGKILIHDRDQLYPLAVNRQLYLVFATPYVIDDPENTAKTLADILDIPKEKPKEEKDKTSDADEKDKKNEKEKDQGAILDSTTQQVVNLTYDDLLAKLSNDKDKYEPILRKVTKDKAEEIQKAELKGIRTQPEDWRYYPENSFAAQVLGYVGFVGDTLSGRYGIEGYYNNILEGQKGSLEGERDTAGEWISFGAKNVIPAKDGANVVLTLDRTIQYGAERYAKEAVEKNDAEEASIIVIDPKTGKILGLSNYPTFNLNEYSKTENVNVFNNSAIYDAYEPGSVMKPIVMAAAIDAGLVGPYSTYNNTGSVKVDNFTIKNVLKRKPGKTTMTEVLSYSLNTGMVYITEKLGRDRLYDYLNRFGFNELTGITLNTEGSTLVGDPSTWSDAQRATIGFGQGIATTELHMAYANAVIANEGKLMQPQIVEEIQYANGEKEKFEPKVVRQVISKETARTVNAMLIDGGTTGLASKARVPGYKLAGKTGTAQVAVNGSYDNSERITSFMGYMPADDPAFLMMVKIVNPKKGIYAETTAIPIYKSFSKEILDYLKIPPEK